MTGCLLVIQKEPSGLRVLLRVLLLLCVRIVRPPISRTGDTHRMHEKRGGSAAERPKQAAAATQKLPLMLE